MNKDEKPARKACGPLACGKILYDIKKRLFPKALTLESEIAFSWSNIVGDEIARDLSFLKLSKNNDNTHTLITSVKNSSFATKFHFMQTSILQKVNTFFGFGLVTDMKIKHLTEETKIKEKKVAYILSKDEEQLLNSEVSNVENEVLKKALQSLGGAIIKNAKK